MFPAHKATHWLAASLLLCAFSDALGAAAPNALLFYLSRGLLGVGEAGFDAAALITLSATPNEQGGRAFGFFTAGSIAGKALALSGAGLLLGVFGEALGPDLATIFAWRLAMLCFAVATTVAASACRGLPPSAGRGTLEPITFARRPSLPPWRVLGVMVAMGAGVFASQALTAFAPLTLVRSYDASPARAGEWLGILVMVTGLTGSCLGGEFAGQRARPHAATMFVAPLLVVVGAAALLWVSTSVQIALVSMGMIVLALSILAPLGLDHVRKAEGAHSSGRLLSSYVGCSTLVAFGLGPPAVGILAGRLHGAGALLAAVCSVMLIAALIGIASALSTVFPRRIVFT